MKNSFKISIRMAGFENIRGENIEQGWGWRRGVAISKKLGVGGRRRRVDSKQRLEGGRRGAWGSVGESFFGRGNSWCCS